MAILCLLATASVAGGTATAPPAEVQITGASSAQPGEAVQMAVTVNSTVGIYGAQLAVTFDGDAASAKNLTAGDHLSSESQTIVVADQIENGRVEYGETMAGESKGATGTGVLARFTLVIAADTQASKVTLSLENVKLADPNAMPIETATSPLTIDIKGADSTGGEDGDSTDGSSINSTEVVTTATSTEGDTAQTETEQSHTERTPTSTQTGGQATTHSTGSEMADTTTRVNTPGFGGAGALLAVAITLLVWRRR